MDMAQCISAAPYPHRELSAHSRSAPSLSGLVIAYEPDNDENELSYENDELEHLKIGHVSLPLSVRVIKVGLNDKIVALGIGMVILGKMLHALPPQLRDDDEHYASDKRVEHQAPRQ